MKKIGPCRNCKVSREWILYKHIAQSGAESFVWHCAVCNVGAPGDATKYFIAKEAVAGYLKPAEIDALPVIMPLTVNRCVRCGDRKCELHHWAPRAIFGDKECEQWPQDYLCKLHHDEWHHRITPQNFKP